jgi:hypothetical protein
MDYHIEVITLAVSDVDLAVQFYTERAGFILDVDYRPNRQFRVVQFTPPGSSSSVQFFDAERRNYASFIDFADPDGNTWIVQERGFTRTASTTCRRI